MWTVFHSGSLIWFSSGGRPLRALTPLLSLAETFGDIQYSLHAK
jgi:hypothetical protein